METTSIEMRRELIRNDERLYIERVLGNRIWSRQAEIVKAVQENKRVAVKSCHSSGKSFIAARIALKFLHSYPHSTVLTTAPTWRQVNDILWKEINTAYNNARYKLPGTMLDVRYNIDEDWFGVGLSTTESDKFQGYHSNYILVIVDEASGVEKKIYDAIEGVTSTGFTRVLLIGNPNDPTGYFADAFKSPIWTKITISCFDTPNFNSIPNLEALKNSTEEQRREATIYPYLITPQWVWERMQEWGEDSPLFQARCLGEFPTESTDTLIALKYAEAALRNENPKDGDWFIGLDVARMGDDRTAFVIRKGDDVKRVEWFQKEDTMQTVGRAINFLQEYPEAKMRIDAIGVGAGVVDRLKESEYSDRVEGVSVAESTASEGEMKYVNIRAKLYWRLRQKFMNGEIRLIDRGTIVSDLTNLKYRFRSSDGAVQIESKEELKKRGLRSPDLADALALSYAEDINPQPDIYFV